MIRRLIAALSIASVVFLTASVPARAQDATSKDTAAAIKGGFVEDLGELERSSSPWPKRSRRTNTWRPMDGVRSVSEVLMLAAFEGYAFIPNSFGAKAADLGSREEAAKLRTLSDKPQVIDHLKKGFAHAKQQLGALDAATLTGTRKVMGRDMSVVQIADGIGGDLHEHLGQLIAYARMNHIVPPWSK